jgi:hypothetical protein
MYDKISVSEISIVRFNVQVVILLPGLAADFIEDK